MELSEVMLRLPKRITPLVAEELHKSDLYETVMRKLKLINQLINLRLLWNCRKEAYLFRFIALKVRLCDANKIVWFIRLKLHVQNWESHQGHFDISYFGFTL